MNKASDDPTLRLGVHAGATLVGFFSAVAMSWTFKLSSDAATEFACAIAALATSASHYLHAWVNQDAKSN